MKLAYLVNQYPMVSHTFIRREIAALEEAGAHVERFAIRAPVERLEDPLDREELARTRVILRDGAAGLLRALAAAALTRPGRFCRALGLAVRIGWCSDRGLLRHLVYLAEACVLRRSTDRLGCTHVHAHFGTNSAVVAMLCQALGGPPYSFTAHGPEEFDKPGLIHLEEKIRRARFVVAISSYCRSQLFRYCDHSDWNKIHVVRCGVDQEFLEGTPTEVPETRRLVCVGRLAAHKGQLLLVEAAARVASGGEDLELVLVGDGAMRGELETLIERLGMQEQIRVTGWASGERVRQELRDARALVLTSFAEGLPVVIMEALALGRPVLSTLVCGIPELVVPGKSGWLIPAGSLRDLTAALELVLTTPASELTRLGAEGRRRVQQLHDARTEARTLLGLFERYAEGGPGRLPRIEA